MFTNIKQNAEGKILINFKNQDYVLVGLITKLIYN